MEILNIENSFMQFTENSGDCEFVLPVETENDIKFQVAIGEIVNGVDIVVELFVIRNDATVTNNTQLTAAIIPGTSSKSPNNKWLVTDKVISYWSETFSDFNDIPFDQCFKYLIRVTDGAIQGYYSSRCFKKIHPDRYTSTLEYVSSTDNYGFNYCEHYVPNKVRLPLFVSRPQYTGERTIYYLSNGGAVVTKSQTRKEYECKTDHMPDEDHQKVVTALEHEWVYLEGKKYTGEIKVIDAYDIAWADLNSYELAPAAFKVIALPFNLTHNNCADCGNDEEFACLTEVTITTATAVDGVIVVQWEIVGTVKHFLVSINGSAPVQNQTSLFESSGHPPGEYEISVTPVCENEGVEHLGTPVSTSLVIPEVAAPCVAVTAPTGDLANARVNELFKMIIPLSGTQPFTIQSAVKPAWMNISIAGSWMTLTGTPYPGSEGNNFPVTILIGNCGGSFNMARAIDVIGNVSVPIMNIRMWDYYEEDVCHRPYQTVYVEAGNYNFANGLKVYQNPTLTDLWRLKYFIDHDGNLWRTNPLGALELMEYNFCGF